MASVSETLRRSRTKVSCRQMQHKGGNSAGKQSNEDGKACTDMKHLISPVYIVQKWVALKRQGRGSGVQPWSLRKNMLGRAREEGKGVLVGIVEAGLFSVGRAAGLGCIF